MKKKYLEDSAEDYSYVDQVVRRLYGCSDEQLLKELEEAQKNPPPVEFEIYPDEFDRIWEDIQAERQASQSKEKGKARRFSWKRAAAIALAACMMTGSACLAAWGTKTYFYRERSRGGIKGDIVFNNDMVDQSVNGEEEAYQVIEEQLGIKPIGLGYMPKELEFSKLMMTKGTAILEFQYKETIFYMIYQSNGIETSINHKSDSEVYETIQNKWTGKNIEMRKEITEKGTIKYEAQFIDQNVLYEIVGELPGSEFIKILEGLHYN